MTREAFIARWQKHVIGVIVTGTSKANTSGRLTFHDVASLGNLMVEIPAEAEKLLKQLYDDLHPEPKPAAANGQQTKVVK